MAFCAKCGTQLADGAKFCASCGAPAGGGAPASSKPATEKVGTVKKCPACGAEVESFQTRCPACGHEMSGVTVAASIQDFFDRVNEFEQEVVVAKTAANAEKRAAAAARRAEERADETRKSSLFSPVPMSRLKNMFKLLGIFIAVLVLGFWMLIDFSGACIALGIVAAAGLVVLILVAAFRKPSLVPAEESEKTFVENFPVPNAKEDMIEFMIFVTSKIKPVNIFKSLTQAGKLSLFWNEAWERKSTQLYNKAQLSMTGDKEGMEKITRILSQGEAVMKRNKTQNIAILSTLGAVAVAIASLTIVLSVVLDTKVPVEKTYAASEVEINGGLADCFRVAESDILIQTSEKGTAAVMTLTVEKIADTAPVIDAEINKILSSKQWKRSDCTVDFAGGLVTVALVKGLATRVEEGPVEHQDALKSLLNLKVGESKRVKIPIVIERNHSTGFSKKDGEKKQILAELMSLDDLNLSFAVRYKITNSQVLKEIKDWNQKQADGDAGALERWSKTKSEGEAVAVVDIR